MTLFRMTFRLFSQVQVTDWFNAARQKLARQAQFAY
jgi:hypothetical protein